MVSVENSSLKADTQAKLVGLVWWLAVIWCRSVVSEWTMWMTLSWWQCYKHSPNIMHGPGHSHSCCLPRGNGGTKFAVCMCTYLCICLWDTSLSSKTAELIWLKFCRRMEVCPRHCILHFLWPSPLASCQEIQKSGFLRSTVILFGRH